jgi:hypothetical protein
MSHLGLLLRIQFFCSDAEHVDEQFPLLQRILKDKCPLHTVTGQGLSSNLRLGNQEYMMINCAPASSRVGTEMSEMPVFHISFEFFCFRVHVFIVHMGFFAIMVSFFETGDRGSRTSMHSSQLPDSDSKDTEHEQSGFCHLVYFTEKESCSLTSV